MAEIDNFFNFKPVPTAPPPPSPPVVQAVTPQPGVSKDTLEGFFGFGPKPVAPPISQWPGVIGRTYLHAVGSMGEPEYSADVGAVGGRPPAWQEGGAPAEPSYGGALGYGQRFAQTAGGPAVPLAMAYPLATIGGDVAAETGKQQLGAGELGQAFLGAVGGAGATKIGESAVAGVRRMMPVAPPPVIPPAGETLASVLRKEAGVVEPATTRLEDMKDSIGQTIQKEFSDPESFPPKQVKRTGKIEPNDLATHLKSIHDASTPSEAVDTALSRPEYFQHYPADTKTALGSWFAHQSDRDPQAWLGLDPAHQRALIPDEDTRAVITNTAQDAVKRLAAAPASIPTPAPSTVTNTLNSLFRDYGMPLLKHKLTHSVGIAGGLHMLGLPAPAAEMIAGGLTYGKPLVRMMLQRPGSAAAGAATPQNYNELIPGL